MAHFKQILLILAIYFTRLVLSGWLEIRLPSDILQAQKNGYICKYEQLPPETTFATKFLPQPHKEAVEQMFLYGCASPRKFTRFWIRNPAADVSPCEDKEDGRLIFSWTKNIQSVDIPENVGYKLGPQSNSNYLVMCVHYSKRNTHRNSVDQLIREVQTGMYSGGAGIDVYLTPTWQKYLAGMYSFSSKDFSIPSSQKYNIDIGCRYKGKRIAPFAFHCASNTHDGQSVLAYRIRKDSWTLIGKANPQDPSGFYPIADKDMMVIKPGDYLALRCMYDKLNQVSVNEKNNEENNTETCKFYFMYYMLNKNVPPHQYEEKCNSLIENVMKFPLKNNESSLTSTSSTMNLVTTSISTSIIADKTNIISEGITKDQVKMFNSSTSTTPKTLDPIHSNPGFATFKRNKPKIMIDPSYVGPKPSLVDDWVVSNEIATFGFIASIALSNNQDIVTLHRGYRNITADSFDDEHYYTDYQKPIKEMTVVRINHSTGKILKSFGDDIFYLPHSLTIDDEGNYWVTDIGLHQVIKISSSAKVSLTLGVATIPGSDDHHFCKPTDVAIDEFKNIYVADGYCNNRVMKYDKNGNFIRKWGSETNVIGNIKTGQFLTPHSLSINNQLQHIYVSDLQSGNILEFDLNGHFLKVLTHVHFDGKLFSINFNPAYGVIYTLCRLYDQSGVIGHVISSRTGKILTEWNIIGNIVDRPHDIAISDDNTVFYMPLNNILWKFRIDNPQENSQIGVDENNYYSEIKIIKPIEDDKSVLPAVIVVTILAIPVLLAVVTMFVQHIRMKCKRNKVSIKRMEKHRFWNSPHNEVLCYGCCITRKHYYDGNRGMGNFMVGSDEESSDCDEEDLFTGKA